MFRVAICLLCLAVAGCGGEAREDRADRYEREHRKRVVEEDAKMRADAKHFTPYLVQLHKMGDPRPDEFREGDTVVMKIGNSFGIFVVTEVQLNKRLILHWHNGKTIEEIEVSPREVEHSYTDVEGVSESGELWVWYRIYDTALEKTGRKEIPRPRRTPHY